MTKKAKLKSNKVSLKTLKENKKKAAELKKKNAKMIVDCTHLVKNILDISKFTKVESNINEMFRKMRHHNSSMRKTGVFAFKELVKNPENKQLLTDRLNEICNELPFLIMDKEDVIRKEAHKCLNLLLKTVDEEDLSPFFEKILIFLQSAMTHINLSIQEDSLLLLDAILEHCSRLLVTGNMEKILPSFTNLISRIEKNLGLSKNLTLKIDQNRQIFGIQWRLKVFSRFYRILKAFVDEKQHKLNARKEYPEYSFEKIMYVPKQVRNVVPGLSSFFTATNGIDSDLKCFNDYFFRLVALLFETWIEIGPDSIEDADQGVIMKNEVVMVLKCILEIVRLVCELIGYLEIDISNETCVISSNKIDIELRSNFIDEYKKFVESMFLPLHPISQHSMTDKEQKKLNTSARKCNFAFSMDFGENCESINSLLEKIFAFFDLKCTTSVNRNKRRKH